MLVHVVMCKLKDPSPEKAAELRQLLLSMEGKVPQLRSIEVGINIVPSERAYDLVLITRFDSLEAMNAYQVDPYHHDVVLPQVRAASAGVVAVDYHQEA